MKMDHEYDPERGWDVLCSWRFGFVLWTAEDVGAGECGYGKHENLVRYGNHSRLAGSWDWSCLGFCGRRERIHLAGKLVNKDELGTGKNDVEFVGLGAMDRLGRNPSRVILTTVWNVGRVGE